MQLDASRLAALSAALRHIRDAEALIEGPVEVRSVDNAWHLAGFGPECARKAMLTGEWLDKAIGHGVAESSELAVAFATAHEPAARRHGVQELAQLYPELGWWDVSHRYLQTGTVDREAARTLVAAARRCVDAFVLAAWSEGRIPGAFQW